MRKSEATGTTECVKENNRCGNYHQDWSEFHYQECDSPPVSLISGYPHLGDM